MSRNIDIIALILPLAFGILFLAEALGIPAGSSDSIGPRLVPLIIAASVIVLSLVLIRLSLSAAPTDDPVTPRSLLLQAGPLVLFAALYGQMIVWFGYLIATFLAALMVFRLYRNPTGQVIANAAAGAVLFYLAFVKGMGIYDPPGSLIDISGWLIW